jgi:NIPSNAP
MQTRRRLVTTATARWPRAAVALALAAALAGCNGFGKTDEPAKPVVPRYFELRTYTAAEGKLDALNRRFREHTDRLFRKHGIEPIGYWIPDDPVKSQNTLVYLLAYPSREARDRAWVEFQADPQWQRVLRDSEVEGRLVTRVESIFLKATDYSPMK